MEEAAPAAAESAPAAAPADNGEAALSDEALASLAAGIEGDAAQEEAPAEGEKPPGEEKPAETKAEPEKPAPEDEVAKARRLGARLARRKANLDQREQSLKAIETKAQFVDQLQRMSRADKLKALNINEDEVVDDVLARHGSAEKKPPTPEERIAKLEAERDAARAEAKRQSEQAQQSATYTAFRNDVVTRVKADESLDLVNSGEFYDDVLANMGAYHAKHGVIPDPVMVARAIENELTARLSRSKKFQPVTGAPTKTTPPASTSQTKKQAAPSPSLTDRISDTPVGDDGLPDDPEERLKIAWARLSS